MSIDIEHELRAAMEEFTADVQAAPDLLARLRRPRRRVAPLVLVAFAGSVAAAVIAAVVVVAGHTGSGSTATAVRPLSTYQPPRQPSEQHAAQTMADAVNNWGPTRGDKANDGAVITALREEWDHPTQHPTNLGSFEPVQSPDGPMRVLWAGTTPAGVAALAVQHTQDSVADYWYGIYLPDAQGAPRLAQRGQLVAGTDLAEFDPHLLSFTLSPAHDAVVVVPTDANDTVRIAFRTASQADRLVPQWTDVPVRNGAAIASVASGGNVWGTVVEIRHHGQVVADHRLDFIATTLLNEGAPRPSNALGLWCNGCSVNAGGEPGYSKVMLDAWATREGPAYLPVWTGQWSIGARLPDGASVLAIQLWEIGQRAHTVVLVNRPDNSKVEVLYDEITDPSSRPLVAQRLPQSAGWLVGAGPKATVTGWRAPGGEWHDVASKKALLVPADIESIELRMVVSGKTVVVTR